MKKKRLIFLVIGVVFLFIAKFGTSFGQSFDIEACIIKQDGDDLRPIKIFNQNVSVGDTVKAPLCKTADCTGDGFPRDAWDDFMPTLFACPPFAIRDQDTTTISRISPNDGKDLVIIFVRHAGGRGHNPGSEGYVRILNPEWKIIRILAGRAAHSAEGNGVEIDKVNGIVRWSGRGDCPGCACLEYNTDIAFLVEKTETPVRSQGDWNCDGKVSVSDVVGVINYLFKNGPGPACELFAGDSSYIDCWRTPDCVLLK